MYNLLVVHHLGREVKSLATAPVSATKLTHLDEVAVRVAKVGADFSAVVLLCPHTPPAFPECCAIRR
jgi:hypothetical protein